MNELNKIMETWNGENNCHRAGQKFKKKELMSASETSGITLHATTSNYRVPRTQSESI